ncbi:MAG: hypothetical protein PHZ02_08725 [Desulfocapsaceae bacterium]|nr:hypothetical protein [Desulfocapsaceae bacterium]
MAEKNISIPQAIEITEGQGKIEFHQRQTFTTNRAKEKEQVVPGSNRSRHISQQSKRSHSQGSKIKHPFLTVKNGTKNRYLSNVA